MFKLIVLAAATIALSACILVPVGDDGDHDSHDRHGDRGDHRRHGDDNHHD